MKKFALFFALILAFFTTLNGCAKPFTLDSSVSELRCDLFYGESKSYSLKAGYGFKESPFINDGSVGKIVHTLNFRLLGKETDLSAYTLSLELDGQTYKTDFKLNPVKNSLTAEIEVDDFNQKEFTVTLSNSSASEKITLKSTLPENTLSYSDALLHLQKDQANLVSHYLDVDGNFNAEIYMRVIVKDQAPYWYVGFASGNEQLKALLVDGISGEVLAIREIF
jgi:hypothetical protein